MLLEQLKKYDILLASGSPRRKQLLSEMGLIFRVQTKEVKENFPSHLSPSEAALFLSRLKSQAFGSSDLHENTLLITADTLVCVNNQILGKPQNEADAFSILKSLSGRQHEVITGVCLRNRERFHSFSVTTHVHFSNLTDDEIRYYILHYKPFDKAGAYGIQEWIGHIAIERITGSYFNVMGLPTHRLYQELGNFIRELER